MAKKEYVMTYNFLQSLYSDIMLLLQDIVVKRPDLARQYETLESFKNFELYYSCVCGTRSLHDFQSFDRDILEKYLSHLDVIRSLDDPNLIPEEYRPQIIADQAQRVMENYVELNNYYRMLIGLPDLEDHRFIYVHGYDDIPDTVPIHMLSDIQISRLEIRGVINSYKKQYPDKKYLDFLGSRKVDLIEARIAQPFAILRLGVPSNTYVTTMFEREYYGARRYVMANLYNSARFTSKELHDPYIGLLMLTLGVRNTLVPTEAEYLNFEEILDAILQSYDFLQYFKGFPFTFKKKLVLALDKLLAIKGTDGVLIDICRLFSDENFTVNRYYLLKTHKKTGEGGILTTENPLDMYDLYFTKVDIDDSKIDYSGENNEPYHNVVDNDYLWQVTEGELRERVTDEFNTMLTKYLNIEAAYDLSSLTFEVCYFINLILQSRENVQKIAVPNQYSTTGKSDVYTMIVFLLAALAKRSQFDGNIVYDPRDIADILRFNYEALDDEVKAIVDKYELRIDVDVDDNLVPEYEDEKLDRPLGNVSDSRLVEVYVNNKEFYDAIMHEMQTTTDVDRYINLYNLKRCLYTSSMQYADFRKANGSPAATYYDMLDDLDPKLSHTLDTFNMEKEEELDRINNLLVYVLERLEELFNTDELKYLFLNTPSTYGAILFKYLRIAINVFKASSEQLDNINVVFYLGDSDPVRVMDKSSIHRSCDFDDDVHIWDDVTIHKEINIDDHVFMMDKVYFNVRGGKEDAWLSE